MSVSNNKPETTIQTLDAAFPKQEWRIILLVLHHTGVADTNQLKAALSMTQNILKRRLELLLVCNHNGQPLISELDRSIKRPAQAHRPAAIYRLEKGGAELLLSLGVENARACALHEDIHILHALCMLTIHLEAMREKDLTIVTDQNLYFAGGERHFRPDHQVSLPNGERCIIEIEQEVKLKLLPRIMESLANRQAFFNSKEGQAYSKTIRMILNIKDGRPFSNTIKVWSEAMRQQEIKSGQELGFTICAIPIQKFLEAPEWGSALSRNWKPIVLKESGSEEALKVTPSAARSQRPMEQDAALLQALGQRLHKTLANTNSLEVDMGFISVIEEIYGGSFGEEHRDFDSFAAPPKVSIGLLKKYLQMKPDLKKELYACMHYYRSGKVWTQINVMHQMGVVIRTFLNYHNWAVSGYLEAYPTIDSELRNAYLVKVEFMAFPDSVEYSNRRQNMEAALTWVLTALFEHGNRIGLKRPEFW